MDFSNPNYASLITAEKIHTPHITLSQGIFTADKVKKTKKKQQQKGTRV